MRRGLVLLWSGIVLPFALTLLNGGPDGWLPHVLFHPVYIGFLTVGVLGVRELWKATSARAVRGLAASTAATAVLAMAGHSGEFIAVLRNGGLHADETVFDVPLHRASATVTVPMVMLAIVLVMATTVTASLVRRGKPVGPTVNRWVRNVHRWTSLVFLASLALLVFFSGSFATVLAITALVVLALTGVPMSGRHYLTKWRRSRRHPARDRTASAAPVVSTEEQHATAEVH